MKKGIFIVIIVGMFAYAIYNFISNKDANQSLDNQAAVDDGEEEVAMIGLEKGKKAPDFELESLDGETVKLSDYQGERVMVNFWATWCGPCRAEIPDLQKFHEDTDIVILGVNLTDSETNPSSIPTFLDNFGVTFPILLDKENLAASIYQIQPIPTSYMIDSEGIITYKALGAINYEKMIQEYEKMK
ncbi:TlpA family protein disulfide reductase [Ornithinibacillus gellani]|uniref:TlpA family protein disulfide reductase n=1 Tax=Ornithinibacillus gellani TaxID=2293253 RepID=UPI000F46AFB3|nr:TlpA disulfide reductase family protein [Ornithinibacillus gellani]TQS70592.1 TlpA family protein disulfide reductase [Ornithinibacillus gellani]